MKSINLKCESSGRFRLRFRRLSGPSRSALLTTDEDEDVTCFVYNDTVNVRWKTAVFTRGFSIRRKEIVLNRSLRASRNLKTKTKRIRKKKIFAAQRCYLLKTRFPPRPRECVDRVFVLNTSSLTSVVKTYRVVTVSVMTCSYFVFSPFSIKRGGRRSYVGKKTRKNCAKSEFKCFFFFFWRDRTKISVGFHNDLMNYKYCNYMVLYYIVFFFFLYTHTHIYIYYVREIRSAVELSLFSFPCQEI